uniref:Pyruvate kinase barrel domain-containing protein n=1 Tax=Glossina pallidipes TaxID=7398 RepID=A0A1B0A7V1_GLOPL
MTFDDYTFDNHFPETAETMQLIWKASKVALKELDYLVQAAIALDTKGPEIRTGLLQGNPDLEAQIKINDNLRLSINRNLMDNRERIYVDYPYITTQLFLHSL